MTALDTAFNYRHFTSHRTLASIAADLLPAFSISTKVGYFPDGHDLDTDRLRAAVEQSARELGKIPDTVLLHNPECSPDGFGAACTAMEQLREAGMCRAWGFSTWDPQILLDSPWGVPRPDVAMVRAGLNVPAAVLDAGERLAERAGVRELWGMAPFAGNAADPIWTNADTSLFLAPGQQGSTAFQAGLAAAFAIPEVARLAVGTSRLHHLAELAEASSLVVNTETVKRYRELLRARDTVSG